MQIGTQNVEEILRDPGKKKLNINGGTMALQHYNASASEKNARRIKDELKKNQRRIKEKTAKSEKSTKSRPKKT